jgi:hypothetical protein
MKTPHPQLGTREGRVIHQPWKDRLFSRFGARFGHPDDPISDCELSAVLGDPLPGETRDLLRHFGFLMITVGNDFHPGEKDSVPWKRSVSDAKSLANLNMVAHADYDHVALFNRGDRQSHTAISGQSGGVEVICEALEKALIPPELRSITTELRHELATILQDQNEYTEENPFLHVLYRIHDALSESMLINPESCWPFISQLNQLFLKKKIIHKHIWKGNQILLISREAIHFRLVEHRHLLTEKSGTWRAHISAD